MDKKKLPVSKFELVWYSICAAVILWGLTYFALGLVNRFGDFDALDSFCKGFKSIFKLGIQYWGLIIIAIGAVAGVIVMLAFAKTFDRAADREQRRSARLSVLEEEPVVSEQEPEVVSEAPIEVPEQEIEVSQPEVEEPAPAEEPKEENPEEAPAEEKAE